MSEARGRRFARRAPRERKLPSERDWERSVLLEPRRGPRHPELISDGAGLPFASDRLIGVPAPLDPEDPAVCALRVLLAAKAPAPRASDSGSRSALVLDGWRLLARSDGEALFGRGRLPQLVTVAVRRDARHGTWTCFASTAGRPLRATRNGIRASSWRADPTHAFQPDERVLRVLLSEQSFASGQRADGRVLEPDIYLDSDKLVLTMFVTPRPGFQTGSSNPETPVRIALPEPIGTRTLIDGALAPASLDAPSLQPGGPDDSDDAP